jgi:hypothetical protein
MNDPAALYQQLGNLIATMPDLNTTEYNSPEGRLWLGRAAVLVQAAGDGVDFASFKIATNGLGRPSLVGAVGLLSGHADAVNQIVAIIHRAFARAELAAPVAAQGSFIPVGGSFTAVAALSKLLGSAATSALFVDPYADGNLLTDFAVLAPQGVRVKIWTDAVSHKPALKPTAASWVKQHGPGWPLEVRLAAKGALHDRLVVVDDRDVYTVGQSFNALAKRAPTSLGRVDPDTAKMKAEAYRSLWSGAEKML